MDGSQIVVSRGVSCSALDGGRGILDVRSQEARARMERTCDFVCDFACDFVCEGAGVDVP